MFEKHCQICGIDVKKESAIKKFGKYFCSDKHAEEFVEHKKEEERMMEEERKRHPHRESGGCC